MLPIVQALREIVLKNGGFKMRKSAFTLLELLLVVGIILILGAIALPNFTKTRDKAIEKEALANLKLIYAAEKIYRMETGSYAVLTNTADANTVLKLAIPTSNPNWNYTVSSTNTANRFAATATNVKTPTKQKCVNQSSEEPVNGSGC
jgi:prepilin-type N-terminal cleavage/methylation domain-containing protein